jgi:adenine-specific DNA methylase
VEVVILVVEVATESSTRKINTKGLGLVGPLGGIREPRKVAAVMTPITIGTRYIQSRLLMITMAAVQQTITEEAEAITEGVAEAVEEATTETTTETTTRAVAHTILTPLKLTNMRSLSSTMEAVQAASKRLMSSRRIIPPKRIKIIRRMRMITSRRRMMRSV